MSRTVTVAQFIASRADAPPLNATADLLDHVAYEADSIGGQLGMSADTLAGLAQTIEYAHRAATDDNPIPALCDLLRELVKELREHVSDLEQLGTARAYARGVRA